MKMHVADLDEFFNKLYRVLVFRNEALCMNQCVVFLLKVGVGTKYIKCRCKEEIFRVIKHTCFCIPALHKSRNWAHETPPLTRLYLNMQIDAGMSNVWSSSLIPHKLCQDANSEEFNDTWVWCAHKEHSWRLVYLIVDVYRWVTAPQRNVLVTPYENLIGVGITWMSLCVCTIHAFSPGHQPGCFPQESSCRSRLTLQVT